MTCPLSALVCTIQILACAAPAPENLLRNSAFDSADGITPDSWFAAANSKRAGAFTCTGGVLRISARAPGYYHHVHQTMDIDGTRTHWFEADIKCDTLMYHGNVRYSLLDADGKDVVSNRPLFHPNYRGPQAKWFRVGLPIPAQEVGRVRKLRLVFYVYNDSRKPNEDRALYIRNPSLCEYSGQEYRPLPPASSRRKGVMPTNPFPKLLPDQKGYRLEKGGVGYLNLVSPYIPRKKGYNLKVEVPEGVTYELHLRSTRVVGKVFRRKESGKGNFSLPGSVNWPVGANSLLFSADGTVPDKFKIDLTLTVDGEVRKVEVPVRMIEGPAPGKLPEKRRYYSWSERPLDEIEISASALARAMLEYRKKTGWEPVKVANVTGVFPYRDNPRHPLARKAVGPHGTPIGVPCDSDLQARGSGYFRDRLEAAKMGDVLKNADFVIWDYEPYVTGPVTIGCFCGDCRREFGKVAGDDSTPSADAILGSRVREWVRFRCRQRAATVKTVVKGIKMLAPDAKFGLCTMPMAPGKGDELYPDDYEYFHRFGIDSPLYEDFTDSFCSMSYSPYLRYFRSLEREITYLKKPKNTILENGWGFSRDGAIVALQLVAAYFAGLDRPFIAAGFVISDGDQLSKIRGAMQFIGETEKSWEHARFRRDKYACEVLEGEHDRFWSMDRESDDGSRHVLVMNCSRFKPMTVAVKSPAGVKQTVVLPACSWKLLRFTSSVTATASEQPKEQIK